MINDFGIDPHFTDIFIDWHLKTEIKLKDAIRLRHLYDSLVVNSSEYDLKTLLRAAYTAGQEQAY